MAPLAGCRRPPHPLEAPAAGVGDAFRLLYRGEEIGAGAARGFRLALAAELPARFRLELLPPVGGARLVLVSDGNGLRGAAPGERLCSAAESDVSGLDRLIGLPVGSADLLRILLGRLAPSGEEATAMTAGTVVLRPELDGEGALGGVTLQLGSGVVARVAYGAFIGGGAGAVPERVRLMRGERGVALELREADAGRPPAEAFELPCPAGFRQVPWDDFAAAVPVLLGGNG